MIPKILHQIWLNDISELPEDQAAHCQTWKLKNQDFSYILWDNSGWDQFGGKDFWMQKCNLRGVHPGITSDILRALLVDKFGGFYADTDTECHSSIAELCNTKALVCYDNPGMIMGGFFGGVAGNSITRFVLENLSSQGDLLSRVGCQLFNRAVVQNLTQEHTVLGRVKTKEFLTHHYKRSWL